LGLSATASRVFCPDSVSKHFQLNIVIKKHEKENQPYKHNKKTQPKQKDDLKPRGNRHKHQQLLGNGAD
jgi:hypothetical protein